MLAAYAARIDADDPLCALEVGSGPTRAAVRAGRRCRSARPG